MSGPSDYDPVIERLCEIANRFARLGNIADLLEIKTILEHADKVCVTEFAVAIANLHRNQWIRSDELRAALRESMLVLGRMGPSKSSVSSGQNWTKMPKASPNTAPPTTLSENIPASTGLLTPTPMGFLFFALKRLPVVAWVIGAGSVLAVLALAAYWKVPVMAAVLGSVGIIMLMFVLFVFACLVTSRKTGIKPPMPAVILLWTFTFVLAVAAILLESSVFFNMPMPLRDYLMTGNH